MEDGEAEPQQACQLWLLMELVRELQAPTQKATTTQEIHSQETKAEQPVDPGVDPHKKRAFCHIVL